MSRPAGPLRLRAKALVDAGTERRAARAVLRAEFPGVAKEQLYKVLQDLLGPVGSVPPFRVALTAAQSAVWREAARVRGVTVAALVRDAMRHMADSALIDAVLDDGVSSGPAGAGVPPPGPPLRSGHPPHAGGGMSSGAPDRAREGAAR